MFQAQTSADELNFHSFQKRTCATKQAEQSPLQKPQPNNLQKYTFFFRTYYFHSKTSCKTVLNVSAFMVSRLTCLPLRDETRALGLNVFPQTYGTCIQMQFGEPYSPSFPVSQPKREQIYSCSLSARPTNEVTGDRWAAKAKRF